MKKKKKKQVELSHVTTVSCSWSSMRAFLCNELDITEDDFRCYHEIIGGQPKNLWNLWHYCFATSNIRNEGDYKKEDVPQALKSIDGIKEKLNNYKIIWMARVIRESSKSNHIDVEKEAKWIDDLYKPIVKLAGELYAHVILYDYHDSTYDDDYDDCE